MLPLAGRTMSCQPRRLFIAPLAALALVLLLTACSGGLDVAAPADREEVAPTVPLELAVPFTLPRAQGGDVSLTSYQGKSSVVLVFYRAFW